jgi:hypothetical protein
MSTNPSSTTIDSYLDELAESLTLPPSRALRVLRECEDHLYDAAYALIEAGAEPSEAERAAVQRFGNAQDVARGFMPESIAWVPLVRAAAGSLYNVAVVGLIAVGLSGLLALALSGAFGRDFVAGDAPGVTYTAARCADYFEYEPGAGSCNDAAVQHHFGEIVDYRLMAGVLGLVGLGAAFALSRRRKATRTHLPATFTPTVGASIFGAAALGLLALSGGSAGQMGANLSGALIAAAVAAFYALRLSRLLTPAAVTE